MKLLLLPMLLLVACGPSPTSRAPQPAACPSPASTPTFHAEGTGSLTTAAFAACGDWSADMDWHCPDDMRSVVTTVLRDGRDLEAGPFGDGTAGMIDRPHHGGSGSYSFRVLTDARCSWSIDVGPIRSP